MVSSATTDIPHALDLVIDFVNTVDTDVAVDTLATTAGLDAWLKDRGVLDRAKGPLTETDREQAVALREALRSLMLANNGEPAEPGSARELEQAARRGDLGVHFDEHASVQLRPAVGGLAGALARILVPVADAVTDGSWARVKACRADDCRWAFYDRSRNRSGVWCQMAVCGNRTKVRAYRARTGA